MLLLGTWTDCYAVQYGARVIKQSSAWASARRGKWGQLTPVENGWKIKKRKRAKRGVFYVCYILRAIRAGRCRERHYADHMFIQIYFRMHNFVVKFSKKIRLRRQGGIDPPNQNPADVPGGVSVRLSVCPVDRQQQRRPAGLLMSSGAGSGYRSIAACGPRKFRSDCKKIRQTYWSKTLRRFFTCHTGRFRDEYHTQ